MDTIFALATSAQPAQVALIRTSGPACVRLARELLGASFDRTSLDASIALPAGAVPCRAWLLPAPQTLTGEDVIELRIPGNLRVVTALEARLSELGLRRAQPGEFTRRALDAGKLDLSRAQGVAGLINSQSEAERRQALADLSGETARLLASITERLRALCAAYEVAFDFSEDEPEAAPFEKLHAQLISLSRELSAFCAVAPSRPRRQLPVVALFGPPNAGKSSLFNALLGKRRALVSDVPGTTRDPVSATCEFCDLRAELRDLSGVGGEDSDAGRFAQVARDEAIGADLLLLLCAPGQEAELSREYVNLSARDPDLPARSLWIATMADRVAPARPPVGLETLSVSALTGRGLEALRAAIAAHLAQAASGAATSQLRSRAAEGAEVLAKAAKRNDPPEALAGFVRRALALLDEALVSQAPGEVLDLIFSRFCIGK